MDTIFVLNTNRQVIDILSNNGSNPSAPFFGDTYTSELDTGAESYEFTTINNARTNVTLEVGNYVLFKYNGKYKLFQIMETTDEHSEGKKLLTVYAEMAGMELRNDYCEPFNLEGNFINLLERILQDTNWRVGTYSESLLYNIQPIRYTEPKNVYSIIQENLATFGGVEIEFRAEFVSNQLAALLIDCYESGTRGNKKYRRFEYGKDVKGITRERNINDLATAVIGQGNNNLTFKDIEWSKNLGNPCDKPLQQDFVVDVKANDLWNNGGKYIKTVHKVDTDDAQTLLQECWDYLQEIKQPKFDYDVDLALVAEDYQDIGVGDTNYVLDFDYQPAILLEARVGKLELSFADPRDNKCTLTNYKELISMLQQPVDLNTVGNMIQSKFPIEGEDIAMGAIGEGHINVTYYQAIKSDIMSAALAEVDTLIADKADITELTALNAEIGNLKANKADVEDLDAIHADIYNLRADKANIADLNAINADILDLKANKADIEHLNAANARIDNLTANKADITDLNAANGNITNLTSQVGHINTIINGHFTGTDAQVLNITAQNTTFDNAVIKDAMIDTVSANKVNTGTINTNDVNIESEDGGIKISGTTQQFKDKEGHVRVQIGKDAQGNFTFCLFSQDGTGILLDETGIKAGAVPDGLIVNDMVADNANISGDKIDIASVITNINNNTTSIKSSTIKFDDTGQTLQVAFNELKTKVDTIDEVVIGGDLSSVIEQVTTNTTNIGVMQGQISSLISNTTITKEDGTVTQLKDEYNSTKDTVNSHTTKIGSLETNYNKVSGDLASVTSKQLTLEQNLDEVSSTLTQTTTTANDALSKATTAQQNLDGFKTTVSTTYTTKTDFNDLSIGGRNFLIDTKTPKTYTLDTSTSTSNHLTKDPYKTYNHNQLSSYGFKVGDKITVSYDWKVTNVTTYGSFITELVSYANNTSTYVGTFGNKKTVTSSETSGRIETTISLTEQMLTANKLRIRTDSAKWTFTISNVKLEKGNKATDWSPAPEDMTTKDEFNNLEIGTRNLLRNGAFLNSTDYWELASVTTLDEEMKFNGHPSIKIVCSGYTDSKYYGAVNKYLPSHVNSFLAGDTYTYSCWYYVEDTSTFDSSFRIRLRGVAEGDTNSTNRSELTVSAKDLVQGKWTKISKTMTFTKNATNCYLQPCVKQNGTIWITDVQLERGERATDWTPAPEDIDDDITVVKNSLSEVKQTADGLTTEVSKKLNSADLSSRIQQSATDIKIGFNKITNFLTIDPNNGLQVNHEDGSYTRIGAGGLELYQAYTGYRYKSLIATGSFSIKGRGTAVVTLPAQFDNVQDYEIEIFYTIETSFAGTSSMVDKTCICDMYANDLYHISFEKDSNGHWTRKVDYSLKDMCIVDGLNMHVGDFGDMSGYVHWIAFA